ncbi:MAG TPA: zf-HC2 domain-containing protein [Bryobacteraceae bacterium]|nr:zf-HC2 domain-containing protein [Bryobacteraceae bacterium]
MFTRHVSDQLAAHVDGQLDTLEARRVESHLAQCQHCRAEHEQIRFGMMCLEHLPTAEAPAAIWVSIAESIPERWLSRPHPFQLWRPAFAALAAIVAVSAAYWLFSRRPETRWEVIERHGVARIGAGEWIETDSSSSATIKVGQIGSVELAPNTRLRVVTERPGEHRVMLARGAIHANISAPPRLFFVDTASGTAVDLGCEYTLRTDQAGAGLLQVTRGWVSFQWKGLESLVPAGASCRTYAQGGPGVPCFDDAPEPLKMALESFATNSAALDTILVESRVRDTLTLWHLLWRADLPNRGRIYERMAALTAVPEGVSREEVLKLDRGTLTRWKDELAWTW